LKLVEKDLDQRITDERVQRLFYALFPDENEVAQPSDMPGSRARIRGHIEGS